ncbi:unnamed protein product [Calypogeia fissa]
MSLFLRSCIILLGPRKGDLPANCPPAATKDLVTPGILVNRSRQYIVLNGPDHIVRRTELGSSPAGCMICQEGHADGVGQSGLQVLSARRSAFLSSARPGRHGDDADGLRWTTAVGIFPDRRPSGVQ